MQKINPDDDKGIIEYSHLTGNEINSEMFQLLNKEERPDSFLNFCIDIGRTDVNYWGKIYERIGILWETNDDNDPIYVLIKHGVNFQSKEKPLVVKTNLNDELLPDSKKKSIFKKLKELFFK